MDYNVDAETRIGDILPRPVIIDPMLVLEALIAYRAVIQINRKDISGYTYKMRDIQREIGNLEYQIRNRK